MPWRHEGITRASSDPPRGYAFVLKTVFLLAIFLAIHIPALAQSTVSRANLQQSMGFEDQTNAALTGWHTYPPDTVSADRSISHTGGWSVRLQRDSQSSGNFSVLTRSLPIDFQGHTVELRGYLKLQDVSGFVGLWLRQDDEGQMLSLENMQSQQVTGTSDWVRYRISLPIDPQARQLFFGVLLSGTGTLWADDLELLVDGKPVADAPPIAAQTRATCRPRIRFGFANRPEQPDSDAGLEPGYTSPRLGNAQISSPYPHFRPAALGSRAIPHLAYDSRRA